jgi:hypothetical protein
MFGVDYPELKPNFQILFFNAPSIRFWLHVHLGNVLGLYALCAALLFVSLSVLPVGCSVKRECRAGDATQHLMLPALA